MAWTEVEYKGKKYQIDIRNYFTSVSTKETVAFEDVSPEKRREYGELLTIELARGFGYRKVDKPAAE